MASWFGGGWFGGQKARDTPKKAILGLRSQLEMLSKREKHLETQIEDQDNLARKHVSSNKNGMLLHLHHQDTTSRCLTATSLCFASLCIPTRLC